MVALPFARPLGLLALLGVAAFVVLYLRRPKPVDKVIPSLMFIMKDNKKSKQYSFFQKLMTNLLFLFQLLSILGLALVAAAPFVKLKYDTTLENTVIIIDVSASMQAKENGVSRLDTALSKAKGAVSGKTSIIMAENIPLIVLEDETSDLAKDVLSKIRPKSTSTNIGDALLLAKDILGERPGRIVVFSDFLPTEGPDIEVVKAAISSDDKIVDFVDVSNNAKNTGIVRLEVTKYTTKVYVKNFNSESREVNIKLMKEGKQITQTKVNIAPYSTENFVFDTPAGISTVELDPKDSLAPDDIAYIATPAKIKNNVMLVTNKKDTNLEKALESAKDINLNVVNPPVLTINTKKEKVEPFKQDIIIVYGVNKNDIVPGTFNDIEDYVKAGGSVVVSAQDDIGALGLKSLAVFEPKIKANKPSKVCTDTINQITKSFEKERCFTAVSSYLTGQAKEGSVIFASTDDKTPMLVFGQEEKGNIVYYGIMDDYSDFKTGPSYPIFWSSLVNFMIGSEDIKDFNFRTGRIVTINEQKVVTPSSTVKTSKLLIDEAGIYEYDSKKYAANLLDEKESDLNIESKYTKTEDREKILSRESKEHEFNLELLTLLLVFILIMSEFFYIKIRGDL
ncbi:MAG TPA: BatA and WFA domain-containing protein [Candidatus Nanoarchaeia archaeon]|nr:BatA and WFA domain-containing protein [Candidatus Nanoarchaeia archaeon]